MISSKPLRRITAPVVAAGPSGKRFCTRLHLSPAESAALTEIGQFLGSLYRRELAGRIRLGRVDRKAQSVWRAERKRALTAVSSSRWAGALTRAVEDQYQLGMRALGSHVGDLQCAIEVLEQRCALRPGETATEDTAAGGGRRRRPRGYATPGSGSPRPGGWPACGSAVPPRRPISPPGIRRSRWVGNGCGAAATACRPPGSTSPSGVSAGRPAGCL